MSAMRREARARAAWIVPAVCAALLGCRRAVGAVGRQRRCSATSEVLANVPLSLGFSLVGALIVSRRPGNLLGRLYLGSATAMALTVFVFQYAHYGLVTEPGARCRAPRGGRGCRPGSGRSASRRCSPSACCSTPTAGCPLPAGGGWCRRRADDRLPRAPRRTDARALPQPSRRRQPARHIGRGQVLEAVGAVGFPLVLFGTAAGIAALAVRWRRAAPGGLERRQLVLLLVAATLCLLVIASPDGADPPPWLAVTSLVVLALVPAAIGVAVLRHRLYEIDVVLNRSLVYAGLTGAIVVLYTALVWALGRPLAADAWATAVAVGIIGALVLPLRTGLQRLVDRAMYGDRGDPYAALSRLTARLQAAAAPGAALLALAEAIAASLRLPYVRVEVASGGSADAGEPRGGPVHELPLTQHGQRVGRLLLEGRDRRPVSARDLQLLTELARPAGAAVAAAALADALSASRARLVQAREDERRRLRRDLHDGIGPTLAGVALGLDLVAARIDDDPAAARALIGELKGETATAVDDVRRLVQGLRPPALDELGLLGALRQQTDRLALRTPDLEIRVDATTTLPPLRAATEVAAYRIALEAVTNSVRHAGARTCCVSVAADDALRLEVVDDGVGIHEGTPIGVGLGAMSERAAEVGGVCTVLPAGRTGTRVVAVLPLGPP